MAVGALGTLPAAGTADAARAALAAHAVPVTCCGGRSKGGSAPVGLANSRLAGGLPKPDVHPGTQGCPPGGRTWAVWAQAHSRELAVGEGVQGVVSRGLQSPGEVWTQGGGHGGEAGCEGACPLADHFDDARGKVAHAVRAPLALVDVPLPAAVGMLLKHLRQAGAGGQGGSGYFLDQARAGGQPASCGPALRLPPRSWSPVPTSPTVLPLPSASSPILRVPPEHTNNCPGVGPGSNPSSTGCWLCGLGTNLSEPQFCHL